MDYDQFNAFCRALPATAYVVQWRGSHVWKVGGKVFAIGRQPININTQVFYNVEKPTFGAEWQWRWQIQLLFPK